MDQSALVGPPVDDGRRLIDRLLADGIEVAAAAWLKPAEEGGWVLYVSSPVVDGLGLHEAYRRVHAALNRAGTDDLTTANIRFVGTRDPLAEELQSILGLRPNTKGIGWVGPRLGGIAVDDAYIYPKPVAPTVGGPAMTTGEVLQAVTDLMTRAGVTQSAVVALRDQTSFRGIPFGVEKNNDVVTLKFIEAGSGHIRSVPVSDVASVS